MSKLKQPSALLRKTVNTLLVSSAFILLVELLILVVMMWVQNNPYGYANIFHITIRRALASATLLIDLSLFFLMVRNIFRKKKRIQFGFLLMSFVLIFFVPFIPTARSRWISDHICKLQSTNTPAHPVTPIVQDDGTIKYHLDEGLIPFMDGGWIYIITHSSHNDQSSFGYIGDLSISSDNKGQLYYNTEHICGGLTIYTKSTNGILNLEHFLSLGNWTKFQGANSISFTSAECGNSSSAVMTEK